MLYLVANFHPARACACVPSVCPDATFMPDTDPFLLAGLLLLLLNLILLLVLLWRQQNRQPLHEMRESLFDDLRDLVLHGNERLERELRQELAETSRNNRQEQGDALARFQNSLLQQGAETARNQHQQLDAMAQQLGQLQLRLLETLGQQLDRVHQTSADQLQGVRQTLEAQLQQLQEGNARKLEEMRQTVDEKLQSTLHTRLDQSFRQVAERLEMVQRGLGEMQALAQGVGDLKHLLTNVKTRGMFGEAQLGALLEQVFAPEQYASQVQIHPDDRHAVDFAIRLPGRGDASQPVWLPIDAKFPNEDYERLLEAQQRADAVAADEAARQLETRIRQEARAIAERYVRPPYTTDFAILFLPSEGLYAEVLRRPGLVEILQREYRITLAGPTTLLAMLNSLQMGFRTLALEQRSSEVWQVLGAVKTEFGKFGDVLTRIKSQTQTVLRTLDQAEVRNRAMQRVLREAEALPQDQTSALLGPDEPEDESQQP